ncbi:MAG: electron transport protein [Bacillota bacterium]
MNRKTTLIRFAALLLVAAFGALLAFGRFEYAYIPPPPAGQETAQQRLGRQTFYGETFGNEVFFTDIMGILDGPLTIPNFIRAVLETRGRGTTNLEVRVSRDVTIGGHTFRKGEKVKTGLDVARGTLVPLGLPLSYQRGRIKIGITCAVCHAAVHPEKKRVMEGVPNTDLNAGLLLAFASNSAAYFPHARVGDLTEFVSDASFAVETDEGRQASVPDPDRFERSVDADFMRWPPGSFDASTDLENNPVQIPDLFTNGEHPYGFTGFAAAGPFHGLTAFNNNFTRDSDPLTQADSSQALWSIPKEVFLGTILQRSASKSFRYDPTGGTRPSAFFARVDPTPGLPGAVEVTVPPSYPRLTPVAPAGLFIGPPERGVWEQANALSVFQNALEPPLAGSADPAVVAQGRAVFRRAGCMECHAGPRGTNNRVIPASVIGTEPSHARSLRATASLFGPPLTLEQGKPVTVGMAGLSPDQLALAWAHGETEGGYKVPGLAGLAWTAPYLHDGGVAVGPPPERRVGVASVARPDPAESLRALLDRELRARVVAANRASPDLRAAHVDGGGHSFWVDAPAGFSQAEQDALIAFLLAGAPGKPEP